MTALILIAWILSGLSIVLIRLGWGSRRPVAVVGWALAMVSLALLARSAGAWGMATGFTVAMIVALTIVLYAGWRSPAKLRRVVRQTDAVTLHNDYGDFGRRVSVFILVVPIAFVAAQWLAYAAQSVVRNGAPLDANSLALTLFLQPVIWTVLMSWQMTLSSPVRMILPPTVATILGLALWSIS